MNNSGKTFKHIILLILLYIDVHAYILQRTDVDFIADTIYRGAGLVAADSSHNISIFVRPPSNWHTYGDFYFVHPYFADSVIFLYNNTYGIDQPVNIEIGSFNRGDPIIFLYVPNDERSNMRRELLGKKLYTGQNRLGIDPYVADTIDIINSRQFSASSRIDDFTAECGFAAQTSSRYIDCLFRINNVILEGVEKCKTVLPKADPITQMFNDNLEISLHVPETEDLIIGHSPTFDSIYPCETSAQLLTYFTTDNSDPRTSSTVEQYTGPIEITETTVLKAYAYFESDTNWFPSEVMTEVYTKEGSLTNHPITFSDFGVTQSNAILYVFSASGQKIGNYTINEFTYLTKQLTFTPGIYFIRYYDKNGIFRTQKFYHSH